ncbi:MAG: ribulose-phosphate 3-epimerase, partial [Actinomycetota bacterium]|nr:ribulose-phosphate 3-epimerase [Actinomycetota bacterium]
MTVKILPSVTTANLAGLGDEVRGLADAGADRIHWDVMDGRYVPNITFGPDVIAACRPLVACGFEAHVMCESPEHLLPRFFDAGCELVTLHPETLRQPHRTYAAVRELGLRLGIALSPATGVEPLTHVLDLVDMVLVMTVDPGFGGQSYLASMEPKVAAVAQLLERAGRAVELGVDGGVGPETIAG